MTVDLDVLMSEADALVVAERACERLALRSLRGPVGVRLVRRGRKVADLVYAETDRLYVNAVEEARPRAIPGLSGKGRVPSAEMIVAMKLLSAASPARVFERGLQDLVDATTIARRGIDLAKVRRLAAGLGPVVATKLAELEEALRRGDPSSGWFPSS
jgi:hypothetical protein